MRFFVKTGQCAENRNVQTMTTWHIKCNEEKWFVLMEIACICDQFGLWPMSYEWVSVEKVKLDIRMPFLCIDLALEKNACFVANSKSESSSYIFFYFLTLFCVNILYSRPIADHCMSPHQHANMQIIDESAQNLIGHWQTESVWIWYLISLGSQPQPNS